ncbi:hypothetical protein HY745_14710, partial [Candidatus Desantisbacteria bacterium]|nr:hypothetical protein [Candidatus Desantisbacteria bacterium]
MTHNQKKYNTLIICLFFISLSLILYNKLLFTNEVMNAKDILADHYYGRNGFHQYYVPFSQFLWSNVKLLGTDESHTYFTSILPDMLFFLKVLPVAPSFAWQMVTFLCLGGIFMYLYCRLLGLSYFGSMIAGLFFMMSSEAVTYMNAGHYTKIIFISYMPLILYFIEKGFQEKKLFNFLISGAILGYIFFYKHEQMLFYICLLVAYYTIFRLYYIYKEEPSDKFKIVKKLFWFSFIMTMIFFAISACGLLPTLNWGLKHSERSGGVAYDFAISWSMPPEELFGYLFPKIFGLSVPNMLDPGKI